MLQKMLLAILALSIACGVLVSTVCQTAADALDSKISLCDLDLDREGL